MSEVYKELGRNSNEPAGSSFPKRALVALAAVTLLAAGACQVSRLESESDAKPEKKVAEQLNDYEECPINSDEMGDLNLIRRSEKESPEEEPEAVGVGFTHKVSDSESLGVIASCYFSDPKLGIKSILGSNPNISNPDLIKTGDKIKVWVTDPETRTSKKDRSVTEIAKITGFDANTIAKINNVDKKDIIESGTRILLPRQGSLLDGETAVIVKAGDSYSKIAIQNEADIVILQTTNGMPAERLQQGQIVVVPSGNRSALPPAPIDPGKSEPTPPSQDLPPEVQLSEFVKTYKEYAEAVEEQYGVPIELVLAIALHESEYGRSTLATKANNFHGLKANGEWGDRPTYAKKTEEYYTDDQLAKAKDSNLIIEPIDTVNGKNHVYVVDLFRQFDSTAAGFLGLGEKLKGEGNYRDAFETADAQDFLKRLVDNNGPKYATDPSYLKKVSEDIRRVQDTLNPSEPTLKPTPNESTSESIENKINSIELSKNGYEKFISNIDTTYMEEAAEKSTYNPSKNGISQEKSELFILHFTTVYYNGIGQNLPTDRPMGNISVPHFLQSTENVGAGIQWLIDRNGKTYQLTSIDTKTAHIPPHSSTATGVEIESKTQEDISVKQYESAAYLAAYNIVEQDLMKEKSLEEVLYGHGQLRTIDRETNPELNVRSDFPETESKLIREKVAELLKEIGYKI